MNDAALTEFRTLFNAQVVKHLDDAKGDNLVFLTKATHTHITESVKAFTAEGVTKEEKKDLHKELGSKLYRWVNQYSVQTVGGADVLCFRQDARPRKKSTGEEEGAKILPMTTAHPL